MGTEAVIAGLFGLGAATTQAVSARHTASANASAQADINEKTMKFNREESAKARDWQALPSPPLGSVLASALDVYHESFYFLFSFPTTRPLH